MALAAAGTVELTAGMTGTAGRERKLPEVLCSVASLYLSLYHSLSLELSALSYHTSHLACSALSGKRLHNIVRSELCIDEHINSI